MCPTLLDKKNIIGFYKKNNAGKAAQKDLEYIFYQILRQI